MEFVVSRRTKIDRPTASVRLLHCTSTCVRVCLQHDIAPVFRALAVRRPQRLVTLEYQLACVNFLLA